MDFNNLPLCLIVLLTINTIGKPIFTVHKFPYLITIILLLLKLVEYPKRHVSISKNQNSPNYNYYYQYHRYTKQFNTFFSAIRCVFNLISTFFMLLICI